VLVLLGVHHSLGIMGLMGRYFNVSLSVTVVLWGRWSRPRETLALIHPLCNIHSKMLERFSTGREPGKAFAYINRLRLKLVSESNFLYDLASHRFRGVKIIF